MNLKIVEIPLLTWKQSPKKEGEIAKKKNREITFGKEKKLDKVPRWLLEN